MLCKRKYTGYTKDWPIRLDQISRPGDCLYWAGVTIMHQTKATARNEKNKQTQKQAQKANALQRTCSASLVRSASLSSSVMGSIFQCSSCREMKDELNKTLSRMGRGGQAPESILTHQVSATGSNCAYYSPTLPLTDCLLIAGSTP